MKILLGKIAIQFHNFLNGQISPMVYIMTFVSGLTGFGYAFLSFLPDIQNSLLFRYGLGIGFSVWGAILYTASVVTLLGLIFKQNRTIEMGSMVCFMMWLFPVWTCFSNGFIVALITYALFHTFFFVYVYLASAMGYIRRVPHK